MRYIAYLLYDFFKLQVILMQFTRCPLFACLCERHSLLCKYTQNWIK